MAQSQLQKLSRYLSWALDAGAEAQSVTSLSGGVHHNLLVTALVEGVPVKYVVRRMPSCEKLEFARQEVVPYSLESEFSVLKELEEAAPRTPKVWGLDRSGEFLGAPAFLMEYIEGPTVLEAAALQPGIVSQRFAETILAMNRISPAQVPSVRKSGNWPVDLVSWISEQSRDMELSSWFHCGLAMLNDAPAARPLPAFGNGDLNPQNFIYTSDGSVAVVDWEYVGFNDPLAELMLLHVWPEDDPFLHTYPIDEIYCRLAGFDAALLPWYELCGALSGWIYSAKSHQKQRMALHERWANSLLT